MNAALSEFVIAIFNSLMIAMLFVYVPWLTLKQDAYKQHASLLTKISFVVFMISFYIFWR